MKKKNLPSLTPYRSFLLQLQSVTCKLNDVAERDWKHTLHTHLEYLTHTPWVPSSSLLTIDDPLISFSKVKMCFTPHKNKVSVEWELLSDIYFTDYWLRWSSFNSVIRLSVETLRFLTHDRVCFIWFLGDHLWWALRRENTRDTICKEVQSFR